MQLLAQDAWFCYLIEAPDDCRLQLDEAGTDFLVVSDADDPATPYWLFDDILVEAARCGEFGLRMLDEIPLN